MTKNEIRVLPQRVNQMNPDVQEVIFWEQGNPNCVVNKLTPELKERAMSLDPAKLALHETELNRFLDSQATSTIEQLRISFWDEFSLACDNGKNMRMAAVYRGTCSREYFYKYVIADDEAFAALLHPPKEYMLQMRSLLNLFHRRVEEILRLPVVNKKGVADTKLIAEITKIGLMMDNRVKGAVVQKLQIDQTSKNLHVHSGYEAPKDHRQIMDELNAVQKEIEHLRSGKEEPQGLVGPSEVGEVIDVEPKED